MGNSTKTLLKFAQLLETEPPILPPTARESVQQLAKELESLAETDTEIAAAKIIDWMQQFTEELTTFENALAKARRQVDEIEEPDSQEIQYMIPNFQIIESAETPGVEPILIAPGSSAPKMSILSHIRQSLTKWMQKNR